MKTVQDPKYYVVCHEEDEVQAIQADLGLLAQLNPYGVAVTAPGKHADFVSRYFAPSRGVAEDPVTGSINCALVPYWAHRLGKAKLHAMQLSRRGGELFSRLEGERVMIAGRAVLYLEGQIYVSS